MAKATSCPSCGALLPEGAAWCPECGTGSTAPCPVCGVDVAEDEDYCWSCQTVFRALSGILCEQCRTPLLKGARFCVACGIKPEGVAMSGPIELEICPSCMRDLPQRRRHCIFCGHRLHT